jgi:uracil-DNA glycosylase family 4
MNNKPQTVLDEIHHWLWVQKELGRKRFHRPSTPVSSGTRILKSDENDAGILNKLRGQAHACEKCVLSKTRTQAVFGTGNEKAELMFVGEAPGYDEDKQGEPFVGKAGQLLTKMIEAMGLQRKDVYIANIIKCRPPENRTPAPEEIDQCMPYLREQISQIRPKVICALGNVAVQTLLQTEKTITRLRGMFYPFENIKIMPTFHPAYLLRNPEYKREVWRDLQLIMDELGLSKKTASY